MRSCWSAFSAQSTERSNGSSRQPRKLFDLIRRGRTLRSAGPPDGWLGIERVGTRGQTFYTRSGIERTLIDALDRPQRVRTVLTEDERYRRARQTNPVGVGHRGGREGDSTDAHS